MIIKMNPEQNAFNLSEEDVKAYMSFSMGRTNYYWKYGVDHPSCIKGEFNAKDLNNHLLGTEVFGGSPFIDNETVVYAGVDFDAHRDDSDTDEDYQKKVIKAQEDSLNVYEFLKSYNLPVILNSSGSAGRHVRWYVGGAPAENVRKYLKFVLYKLLGDPNAHEVFPKQDCLSEDKPYGNQMKMPLCIHPKHKQRANVILNGMMLDISESIKEMKNALKNAGNVPPFSEKDYATIKVLDKSHKYIEKYNNPEYVGMMQDVPEHCAFFEDIASKLPMPSKDKYSRHFCLDPNISAYGISHPGTRIAYAAAQGRTSHTAFDNWRKYWTDGKPEFKCGQIIAYLRNHSTFENKNCIKGLKKCLSCPKFKSFVEDSFEPKGRTRVLNIRKVAEKQSILNCPECNKPFVFNEKKGSFSCKKCGMFGGIRKLLLLSIKQEKNFL